MEILKTKNYDAFKCITSNREVDKNHIKKLVDSIAHKNLLHINPIIVDSDMNVIDGQHRLEACRQLEVEVHYVVSGAIKKEDLKRLNSVQKSWTIMDYINYFTIEGIPEYKTFSNLINQFPKVKVSTLMDLVSKGRWNNQMKEGVVVIDNLDQAIDICKKLDELAAKDYPFVYGSAFIRAFKKIMNTEGFDWPYLNEKIERYPRKFQKCHSTEEYLKMTEELYNYERSKYRLQFTKKI